MKSSDIPDAFADGAYIARRSWRASLPIVVAFGAVDVFLLYQAVQEPSRGRVVGLAVFSAATVFLAVLVARPVLRGEVSFAVDASGVYFGPSDDGARPELIPWSWIDCVVTFDRIVRRTSGQKGRRRCVGVELNAAGIAGREAGRTRPPDAPPPTKEEREFNEAALAPWLPHLLAEPSLVAKQVEGWRLDMDSLTTAVMRHAPDKPIERRPTRHEPGIARLAATAWQVHQNFRRRRGP